MRQKTKDKLIQMIPRYPKACSVLSMAQKAGLEGKKAIRYMRRTKKKLSRLCLFDRHLALLVLDVQTSTSDLAEKMKLELIDRKLIYYTYLEEEVDISAEIAQRTEIDSG